MRWRSWWVCVCGYKDELNDFKQQTLKMWLPHFIEIYLSRIFDNMIFVLLFRGSLIEHRHLSRWFKAQTITNVNCDHNVKCQAPTTPLVVWKCQSLFNKQNTHDNKTTFRRFNRRKIETFRFGICINVLWCCRAVKINKYWMNEGTPVLVLHYSRAECVIFGGGCVLCKPNTN